ncbi:ribonuclease H-like protein, partial [Viridothelium virens]
FWTHELYRGLNGEKIKIHYCKTRAESERIASLLVNEPILGFDMEWKPRGGRGIKNNISLIQLACEDQVALFHVALHEGRTVERLLAPTLRKILESPDITKTGVAILHADGRRLQRFMRLEPRGLFELSHLHRLVKYYGNWPEKVNKKLVGLASQVQEHLGKPLFKGKVRTSDWTKPLDADQIRYSAADAYAGFRLFHAMEMKRLKMVPVPPRPAFAELDLPIKL